MNLCTLHRTLPGRAAQLLLGLALIAGQANAENNLEGSQQREAVAAHDRWRAEVGLDGVKWSGALGTAAQTWANHLAQTNACNMRHATRDILGNTGENLYWAGPVRWSDGRRELQKVSPNKVVGAWGSERDDYDSGSHRCTPGKVCGHYTQMVWKESREIGCAMAQCPDLSQVWVCRYSPAGNIVGRPPY